MLHHNDWYTAHPSKMSVTIYQMTQHNTPRTSITITTVKTIKSGRNDIL